jgi:uncharacterized membrane protein
MMLLPVHIIAGALGIVSGAVALYAVKGATLHRESGKVFVYAMLVLSGSGAVIAAWGSNWATVLQGVLTFYLVTTGLLTVRRPPAGSRRIDVAAMLVALTVGLTHIAFGLEASYSPTGTKYGYPPPLFSIFGPLASLRCSSPALHFSRSGEGDSRATPDFSDADSACSAAAGAHAVLAGPSATTAPEKHGSP